MNGPGAAALGSHAPLAGSSDPALGARGALYTGSDESREPSPMAPAGPILDSRGSLVRRHAVSLAIGSALGLALLSFIVVGAFMKGSEKDPASRAATSADASVAGATATALGGEPAGGTPAPAATDSTATTPPDATPVRGVIATIDAGATTPAGSPSGSETQPAPPDGAPPPDRTPERKADRATSAKQSGRANKRKRKKTTKKRNTRASDRRRGSRAR